MHSWTFDPLACELYAEYPAGIDKINGHARQFLNGNDSCVLGYIDTLAGSFIADTSRVAIVILDSLAEVSDGYVSEDLCNVNVKLFYEATVPYLEYLYASDEHSRLTELLADGLQVYGVESADDP